MRKIIEYITKTPEMKTIIFVLSVILSGILCSAFVTEITINGVVTWKVFYKTNTFWFIILYCIVIYFYNKVVYKYEKNMLNFLDDDYCLAYIRQQCLPELVVKYKTDLKSGKLPKDVIDIKKELKKFGKK